MSKPRLYHLLQLAAQRARKHADESGIAAAGVSAAQGGALFVIERLPGVSQREVARALGQQDSAVATMVTRLLAAGLISRNPRSDDHRVSALALTEKGAAALLRLRAELDDLNRQLEDALDPEEFAVLAEALQKLAEIRWSRRGRTPAP